MKKLLSMAVMVALVISVCSMALAGEETPRTIQNDELMMLEEKDIFDYTSGELYSLWLASERSEGSSIGYVGYAGENPQDEMPGLLIPFEDFRVMTYSDDEALRGKGETLSTDHLEETKYIVKQVTIDEPGGIGPFGVEIGMTCQTLEDLLPELTKTVLDVQEIGYDAQYTMSYQDADGYIYSIKVNALLDFVSNYYVQRD